MPKKTHLTIDDFLATAVDMVKRDGWKNLSITALAHHSGCSTMPIYSHFENLEALKDEVVKHGWKLVREYESKTYTDDPWVDQAIGYVRFARDNPQLFACMLDGRNLALERRMLQEHYDFLSTLLGDYHGFAGLSPKQYRLVRYSRAIFTQGVATTVSKGLGKLLTDDEAIEQYMTLSSKALLEGYRSVSDNEEAGFLAEHFQPGGDME